MKKVDHADTFDLYLRVLAPDLHEQVCRECRFHSTRRWRFDFCFPGTFLAIEIDGGQYAKRGGRHNQDSDREKINAAVALGYSVLRFSSAQVTNDPAACIEVVRKALRAQRAAFEGKCQRCT